MQWTISHQVRETLALGGAIVNRDIFFPESTVQLTISYLADQTPASNSTATIQFSPNGSGWIGVVTLINVAGTTGQAVYPQQGVNTSGVRIGGGALIRIRLSYQPNALANTLFEWGLNITCTL